MEPLLSGWLSFCILLTFVLLTVDLTWVSSILLLNLAKLGGPGSVKAAYFDCRYFNFSHNSRKFICKFIRLR